MTKSILLKSLVVAATLSVAPAVFAQNNGDESVPTDVVVAPAAECASDADCAAGEICEIMEVGVCEACADGEECDPNCTSESYGMCVPPPPPPCASDADCGANEVCVSYTFEECSGGAERPPCVPDEPCEDVQPTEVSCTSTSESLCVPRYVAPCQVDADCGGGFTCEDVEVCSCSGSTGSGTTSVDPEEGDGSTDGGADEMVPEPADDCSCEPTGDKYCELVPVECTADADCAAGLTCMEGPTETSAPCYVDENGDSNCVDTGGDTSSVSYCAPEDFYYWGGAESDDRVSAAAGNESAEVTGSDRIDWGATGDSGDGEKSTPDGGCSATGGANGGTLALLLGLAGMVLRRRR